MRYLLITTLAVLGACGGPEEGDPPSATAQTAAEEPTPTHAFVKGPDAEDGDVIYEYFTDPEEEGYQFHTIVNLTQRTSSAGEKCEEGRVCRGMTGEEVEAILGRPESIRSNYYQTADTWEYANDEDGGGPCIKTYEYSPTWNKCAVTFFIGQAEGLTIRVMYSQTDVLADYIDLSDY